MNLTLIVVATILLAQTPAAPAEPAQLKPPKNGHIYTVAHRGAHQKIPENTLAAYQKAIDLGFDFVEIDVRTTKDGKFVSIHNDDVDHYAKDQKGPVKDFTLAELRAMDIGSRVGEQWKGTQIPTFEEILDLCKGKIGIYLDLKAAPIDQLVPILRAHGMEQDTVWYIGGFEIDQLKAASPQGIAMPDPGPEENLAALLKTGPYRVVATMAKYVSKSFVDTCHAAGAKVITDDLGPMSWQRLLDMGVDGIQTDFPEQLAQYLDKKYSSTK